MTNSNTIDAPTGRPPIAPRPAYVVTYRSMVDKAIWLAVAGLIVFVLGFLSGQYYQQLIFDEAVEVAREAHSPLGTPAVLIVSQWTYKEPAPLKRNPNCRLYRHDTCPFDPPTPPEGEASTSQA